MYSVINKVSSARVPDWGNTHQFIAIHYLGCVGQNYDLAPDGSGAHFTVYWDGRIFQRCSYNAVPWAVGTAGYYKQKHPKANNYNTISIEMCCKCDGNSQSAEDPYWYFTEETQDATVWLVQKLMKELNIPIENVLRHYDIVNKTCPAPYVHNNKYKGTWTWDEFKKKVSGEIETPIVNYFTRKNWNDEKTQFAAYSSKEVAISNCPVGYTVFNKNGKAVYTKEEVSDSEKTDKIWMGWTKRETGSAGLRCIHGDNGKAYGLQFDYRYGLIPFLKYCVAYNTERYAGFKPYIALGSGNSGLIYNQGLGKLWQKLYDSYTEEFKQLQYTCAYQQYYLPAKKYVLKNYGLDMDKCHPAVKGTLWSMSFRSGTQTGAQKFAGCAGKSDEAILNTVYPKYGNNDGGRWTRAGQWGDALNALKNDTYTSIHKEMQKSNTTDKTDSGKITKISEWIQTIKDWEQKMIEIKAVYSNKNNKTDYEVALKQKPVLTNCALFVTHALQVAGIFERKDKFYGSKGTLIKGSAASKMGMIGKITTYDKATVTADKANIPVGAIVTWHEGHTNVYLGKNDKGQMQWSDAGRGTNVGFKENSYWKSFRKTGNMSGYHVANVIQLNLIDDVSIKKEDANEEIPTIEGRMYVVQAGAFAVEANAKKQVTALKRKGFEAIVKKRSNDWAVQCGAFKDKKNADALIEKLKKAGFSAILHM